MSDNVTKYASIIAIIISIVVGIYVYREFSHTRAKIGEIKFLKNQFINSEARMSELETRQDKIDSTRKIILSGTDSEDSSTESEDYEVCESSSEDDQLPTIEEVTEQ